MLSEDVRLVQRKVNWYHQPIDVQEAWVRIKTAKAEAQNTPTNMQNGEWIELSETEPRQGGIYLATDGEDIQICSYWPGFAKVRGSVWGSAWGSVETDRAFHPTHWMQLPYPPVKQSR